MKTHCVFSACFLLLLRLFLHGADAQVPSSSHGSSFSVTTTLESQSSPDHDLSAIYVASTPLIQQAADLSTDPVSSTASSALAIKTSVASSPLSSTRDTILSAPPDLLEPAVLPLPAPILPLDFPAFVLPLPAPLLPLDLSKIAPATSNQVFNVTTILTMTLTTTATNDHEASTVTLITTTTASPSTTTLTPEVKTSTVLITTTQLLTTTLTERLSGPAATTSFARPTSPATGTSKSTFNSTIASHSESSTPSPPHEPSTPTHAPFGPSQIPKLTGLAVWSAPGDMNDLDSFNVTYFPGSGKNLKIVSGIPDKASSASTQDRPASAVKAALQPDDDKFALSAKDGTNASALGLLNGLILPPLTSWSRSTRSMQLLYPANSINPSSKHQGGVEFYASPLNIHTARNVSLQFSVYFPVDFDWVLAGKLPGLYGGHTGCSGGNKALDCFSTRLMWRSGGAGELYLYAAKDKQTKALCSDPRSVCDAAYGFSIGRGSFTWAAGAWTTVTQTVVLNTPGKQDGAFTLDVNGKRVIDKQKVFYRDILWPVAAGGKGKGDKTTTTATQSSSASPDPPVFTPTSTVQETPITTSTAHHYDPLGDILRPLLSEITHLLLRRETPTQSPLSPTTSSSIPPQAGAASPGKTHNAGWDDDLVDDFDVEEESSDDDQPFQALATPERQGESIGFLGLFFSTFFGGHDEKYATPRDQYVWFKDFSMSHNA